MELSEKTISLLSRARLDLSSEAALKMQMRALFSKHGLLYIPEYVLDAKNRPDFFLDGVGIEVKIRGAKMAIYRQCERYCAFDAIKELILVTGTAVGMPEKINNKPVYYVSLGIGWL